MKKASPSLASASRRLRPCTVARFPKTQFVIIDGKVDLPNVQSGALQEHEGSYVVGALAAMVSKTGKLGFVGGMDIP